MFQGGDHSRKVIWIISPLMPGAAGPDTRRRTQDGSLHIARACKRVRAEVATVAGGQRSVVTHWDVDSELQVTSAFLPGRLAANHIQVVARYLLKAVSSIAKQSAMMTNAAAMLTRELGDSGLRLIILELRLVTLTALRAAQC